MPQSPSRESNEYWRQSAEHSSQRLYVAFCELASAALDYSEGVSNRPNNERSNWASTALYYSIVHSARLLVFLPLGDFPTAHNKLSDCFRRDGERYARTDWLNAFLRVATPRVAGDLLLSRFSTEVIPPTLYEYWEQMVETEPAESFLEWLASLLVQAKALRNENNYEALLIAHEFHHPVMTDLFTQFTTGMREAASRTLGKTAQWFDQYLRTDSDLPTGARRFICGYVDSRIIFPVSAWYGDRVAQELRNLLAPLRDDPLACDLRDAEEITRAVDFAIFDPKAGLMKDFRGKVQSLINLVHGES